MKHLTDEELAVVARSPRTRGLGLDAINEMAHRLRNRAKVEAVDVTTCQTLLHEIRLLQSVGMPPDQPLSLSFILASRGIVQLKGGGDDD